MVETIVRCPDGCIAKMRDSIKEHARKQGVFLRCEGNTVILKDCRRVSLVLEDREQGEGRTGGGPSDGAIELLLETEGGCLGEAGGER